MGTMGVQMWVERRRAKGEFCFEAVGAEADHWGGLVPGGKKEN
jgi:hypothetical protein